MARKTKTRELPATDTVDGGSSSAAAAATRPKRACTTQNPPTYAPERKKRKAAGNVAGAAAEKGNRVKAGESAPPDTVDVAAPRSAKPNAKKPAAKKGKTSGAVTAKLSSKERDGDNEEVVVVGEAIKSEEKENGAGKRAVKNRKRVIGQEGDVEKPVEEKKAQKREKGTKATGLDIDDAVPNLKLVDDEGNQVYLHQLVEESGVVIYAYPKANTGGCTQQSLLFKEYYEKFSDKDYRIFGLSGDSTKSQASWKKKHEFPFQLLSDLSENRQALKQLGFLKSGSGNSVLRSHIVVAKGVNGGHVEQVIYGVKPKESAEKALQCIGVTDM